MNNVKIVLIVGTWYMKQVDFLLELVTPIEYCPFCGTELANENFTES